MKRQPLLRRLGLVIILLLCASIHSGCVNFPDYSKEMVGKLVLAKASGVEDRIDTPKSPLLALGLGFVFPCAGEFYAGDIGDGLKVIFTFWTGVNWVKGIIDGFLEAQYRNDMEIIAAWEKERESGGGLPSGVTFPFGPGSGPTAGPAGSPGLPGASPPPGAGPTAAAPPSGSPGAYPPQPPAYPAQPAAYPASSQPAAQQPYAEAHFYVPPPAAAQPPPAQPAARPAPQPAAQPAPAPATQPAPAPAAQPAPAPARTGVKNFCKECGAGFEPDAKFCSSCGVPR